MGEGGRLRVVQLPYRFHPALLGARPDVAICPALAREQLLGLLRLCTNCLDGLVRRYRTERVADGLEGGEAAFLMCSFWLVDVLAMQGKLAEAEDRFRSLLELCNDVGLFAEQYAPRERQLLGNYPQAFTHMALVNSAAQLRRAHEGADHARPLADRSRIRPRARRRS